MILLWNGKEIEAVDLDRVIPGSRAEVVAALLEPAYLRGYLEGRGHDVAIKEIKKKGHLGRDYRQIQKLMRRPASSPPMAAPWQYAMFLKERLLTTTATTSVTTSEEVVTSTAPLSERGNKSTAQV